ncbi:DNA repair protein RecO, partial [Burkholderia mallei]|nr:DNA repair protein RecO [Burkholderia mallei]
MTDEADADLQPFAAPPATGAPAADKPARKLR